MEKKFYVYVHRRKSDGRVFYVGKGSGKRFKDFNSRSEEWKKEFKKHGCNPEVFLRFEREVCALNFEICLISYIGLENLVNLTRGGNGVVMPKKSTRMKMRLAKIGKPPAYFSDPIKVKESIRKTSEALKIPVFSNKGEKFDCLGDAINFLRENGYKTASKGNICSCIKGNQKTAYGRTWSHDPAKVPCIKKTRHQVINRKSKSVVRSDGVIFDSASQAARFVGGSQGNISMVCRGERKMAYGYSWTYSNV